jgi:hypothetical protein
VVNAVGPIKVDYLELHRLANAATRSADDLARLGLSVGATAVDPDLLVSRVLDPVGAGRVDWAIGEATVRITSLTVGLNKDAMLLEAAVVKERMVDASLLFEVDPLAPASLLAVPLTAFQTIPFRARTPATSVPNSLLGRLEKPAQLAAGLLGAGDGEATLSSYRPAWANAPIPSLAEAVRQIDDVWYLKGGIAIRKVAGPTPRYVLLLPGIQDFVPTSHPQDLPGGVAAVASSSTAYDRGVVKAMKAAGVPEGAEVMLISHSLGGIVAMNLAGNRDFNGGYVKVTHVVAAGSPMSSKDALPGSGTKVLEIENVSDIVPHLDNTDGALRPQTPDRAYVAFAHGRAPWFGDAHRAETYADALSGFERGENPWMQEFVAETKRYLDAPTTTQVFVLKDHPSQPRGGRW